MSIQIEILVPAGGLPSHVNYQILINYVIIDFELPESIEHSFENMEAERVDVVVVGTGWNGLISAKTYLEFAPTANLVILDEQSSIGGVWSSEKIYPNLYAQIKYGQFEYSFYPMRREGITDDGCIAGETINRYLNDFAQQFDLVRRTRLQTKVVQVQKAADNSWRLELEGKGPIQCSKLIYASGATSHKVMPSWPQSNFSAPIIHSDDLGQHLDALAKVKKATVVGASKAAFDTVFHLLSSGVQVNWVFREDGSGPLAIVPPVTKGLVYTMDLVSTRIFAHLGSSIMSTKGMFYHFFNRTTIGRMLARAIWRTITTNAAEDAGYHKSPNTEQLRPLPVGSGIFWASAGLGCASVPDFWKVFHRGDCTIYRTEIASLTDNNHVTLRNCVEFDTDYIIACTGYDKSYHQFSPELQRTCGLAYSPLDQQKWAALEDQAEAKVDELLPALKTSPLAPKPVDITPETQDGEKTLHGPSRHYRRLVVPELAAKGDRSIYFPGFIHTIYTPLVSEVQALWGVAFLLDLVDLPSQGKMEREVAEWNVWTRKRYLTQGQKHAYAIYDFLGYIDVLLEDMGIATARKSNPLSELFIPTYPKDYRGLTGEFRQALARKGRKMAL